MKRYLVFKFEQYYPGGGLNDVAGDADNLEEAYAIAANGYYDYVEIFDRIERKIYEPLPRNN